MNTITVSAVMFVMIVNIVSVVSTAMRILAPLLIAKIYHRQDHVIINGIVNNITIVASLSVTMIINIAMLPCLIFILMATNGECMCRVWGEE